jgi:uncharacterized 2Fe-2S/4Fe-4S cluster protein (DUF4445 family)
MAEHCVSFDVTEAPVRVPTGTLVIDAARKAGIDMGQPCGGQGRCGRCAVQTVSGDVRRRSTLRLSATDVASGYALACQSVVEQDVAIRVLPQETLERHLTTDLVAAAVAVPPGYDIRRQPIRRIPLTISPPTMDDQADDYSRLQRALWSELGDEILLSLSQLRQLGGQLRNAGWQVTALVDEGIGSEARPRLIDLLLGEVAPEEPLWAAAIDIGTTTVTVWLVNLVTGEVKAQAAEYNRQVRRGEDVISRIIYASKNSGGAELRELVLASINTLLQRLAQRAHIETAEIVKATIAGNSTMIHLLLAIPAESIRLQPFITAANHLPPLLAREVGIAIHPEGTIDCLPGVASYVGADISAGVLSSGMDDSDEVSLFLDIGTNGETALGSSEWLVTCACSAGPAFEGAGVLFGMRATRGAIEEVWINGETYEPTYRVIGDAAPQGLCGSALISLLGELFVTGIIDKGGHFNSLLPTNRVREGEHGLEYVVAWAGESSHQRDIAITTVDIDNLLRAKAAIYAGFTVLAVSVGFPLEEIERVLVGGAFGKYINVEKAIEVGLLPDVPWDKFHFLGNTSVRGAYLALLDRDARQRVDDIARRMTYVELSADNSFYDAFTSALFLPHTDMQRFPSVATALSGERVT